MDLNFAPDNLLVLIVCTISLWLLLCNLRTQKALQWWFQRQSIHLSHEAETIRDGLLQEAFTIRRSLELSLGENDYNSVKQSQDWLNKVENFHHSLQQLSDRLSPVNIEHSLPMAILWVLESWQISHPQLKFQIYMPTYWRQEKFEQSIVVLRTLDEFLQITSAGITESIHINLKPKGNLGELTIKSSYPNLAAFKYYSYTNDLKYLSQTFKILTSGQSFCRKKNLTVTWYFRW